MRREKDLYPLSESEVLARRFGMTNWWNLPRDPYVDRHGQELAGEDEHGLWLGTSDRPWPLQDFREDAVPVKRRVRVTLAAHWPDGRAWDAVVMAPSVEFAVRYFTNWGFLRELTVL